MVKIWGFLGALVGLVVYALVIHWADTSFFPPDTNEFPARRMYRETGMVPFRIFVPEGWAVTKTQLGVKLTRGNNAFAEVVIATEEGFWPGWHLDNSLKVLDNKLRGTDIAWKIIERGATVLGGERGDYTLLRASKAGTEVIIRVAVSNHNHHTYALILGGYGQAFDSTKPELDRIEASFSGEAYS